MGGKSSKSNLAKKSLNPKEEERVLKFFGLQNTNDKISAANLKERWQTMLVPSFLDQLVTYLVKQSQTTNTNFVTMDAMVLVYLKFVRGTLDELAAAIADLIGNTTKSDKEVVVSYNSVLKYLSDLISSYLKLLENNKDKYLMSWHARSRKFDSTSLSAVVKAWCAELIHKDDEVTLYNLEMWLSHTGMATLMNNLLVSSLYNINDIETNLIPRACLPSSKTTSILDSSQIIYLNSLLPSEYRSQWRFLFSTRTHGESFSTMMGSISNQGPTLLIVQDSDSYTFGGFASDSWNPGPKFVGNETCFLFKLSPETKVFSSTGYNDHFMYVNSNQTSLPNGLGMGGQFSYWGLWLDYQFGIGECSESCTTFRNYVMPAASKKFNIAELEIWGVGDPTPTPEEMGDRVSSVLDKDPTATQMLEMIGRRQHSKGLRESPGRVKPMFPSHSENDFEDSSDE